MKKNYLLIAFILLHLYPFVNAQTMNLNPDPYGDPWITGDLPEVTPEVEAIIDQMPVMTLSPGSAAIELPEAVDNSIEIFMRPVFLQLGGSCGQASGVGYTFTYEINYERGFPANDEIYDENWYPPLYTYNFLNEGNSYRGTWWWEGWDIIMENGCPNVPVWGGMNTDHTQWMTGYDNYKFSMSNRILSYYTIDVSDSSGLNTFKHWLYNHNDTTAGPGGLAVFATILDTNTVYGILPPESAEAGKGIIVSVEIGSPFNHAMTFVGYNDSIKYDYNDDERFTNDIDINGDNIIDIRDWEIGALKIVNS
ncbi:MAG: hypothetical protein KAT48_10330 [Bacteroidales bacterium]|nr:hypothetical protein [Bacteroidales bacterium]